MTLLFWAIVVWAVWLGLGLLVGAVLGRLLEPGGKDDAEYGGLGDV